MVKKGGKRTFCFLGQKKGEKGPDRKKKAITKWYLNSQRKYLNRATGRKKTSGRVFFGRDFLGKKEGKAQFVMAQ